MRKSLLIILIIVYCIEFLNAQQSDYVATFNKSFKWKLTKNEVLLNPEIIVYNNEQTYPVYQIDFYSLKINEVHYSERGSKLNTQMLDRIKILSNGDMFRLDVKIKVNEKIFDLNSIFIKITDKKLQFSKSELTSIALIGERTRQELTINELLKLGKVKVKSNEKLEILRYKVIYYENGKRKQFTNIGRLFNPELKKIIANRKKYSTLLFTDINIVKKGERYLVNQILIKIK